MSGDYRLVFDISKTPLHFDGASMLILPTIGLLMVVTPQKIIDRMFPNGPRGIFGKIFSIFFFVFTAFVTGSYFVSYTYRYFHLRSAEAAKQFNIAAGCLEGFHPMPASGHENEVFKVDGRQFSYSDFNLTPAFHNAESHGGPVHSDSQVRVGDVGDDIIRLEVRDHGCSIAHDLAQPD